MALSSPSLQEHKASLRIAMGAARAAAAQKNPYAAKVIADLFLSHVQVKEGAAVGSYHPFRDEIPPTPLTQLLHDRGHPIALPLIVGKKQPLEFRLFQPGDPLVIHAMGFPEPSPNAPVLEPDILLVPLLAFDRKKHRLGYGGGYYDRTIAALRSRKAIVAIGLAYAAQEIDDLPIGFNDIALDKIITEVNVF